jgi:hypothetical protein
MARAAHRITDGRGVTRVADAVETLLPGGTGE